MDEFYTDTILAGLDTENEFQSFFKIQTANQFIQDAKGRPIPKKLLGDLLLEGEISILFADTGLGKSVLAVQIADALTSNKSITPFKGDSIQDKIIYFDFELSDKQFENRYSINYSDHYTFDERLLRAEINPFIDMPEGGFENFLMQELSNSIEAHEAKIIIVDNLTYLKDGTEKANQALPLMKHLHRLRDKYGLTILALAHTPKRDLSKPLTRNDLQGSKMLINFCDSSFAIGESTKGPDVRYIKQIKVRNSEFLYDSHNVAVFRLGKDYNFLKFDFIEFGDERDHLRIPSQAETEKLEAEILQLHENNPGLSYQEIADKLNTYKMKVKRTVDRNNSRNTP